MPVANFLSEFLPSSELSLPEVVPSFTAHMFDSVIGKEEEVQMYNPFVYP
jgi:hypothetical protein